MRVQITPMRKIVVTPSDCLALIFTLKQILLLGNPKNPVQRYII